ncbi:hypothetical protein [Rhodococcus ruber]|uniref:hypothetical protein n=1 Tax=Rhodococcus ruber TaxID=1830 RepID=UPI0011213D6C|nr:hypothetical protein [Rhodococcus ruber]QDC17398.1 hypothetical protein E2561_24795 [Rhodococcus ruber]
MNNDPLTLDEELELLTLTPAQRQALQDLSDATTLLRECLKHGRTRPDWTVRYATVYHQFRDRYLDAMGRAIRLGVSDGLVRRAVGL